MHAITYIMLHVSATDLRKNLAHWMDRAVDDAVPLLVTRQGHPPMVMIPQSEYDRLDATAYLRASPANARALDAAIARLDAGEGIDVDPATL